MPDLLDKISTEKKGDLLDRVAEIPKTIYAQPVPLEDQIEAETLERELRRQPVRAGLRGPQFPGGTPRDLGPSEPLVRYQRQLEERRRKIQEEEALELFYTTYPEKRPRKYKHFVDELLRNTGGGALNVASGLTGTLASVSGASIFDPEQLEGWAQKLHQKSKEPTFTPAKGGGWRGFVAASVGQAAPYMAAAVGATMLTGTPMAAFGVGYSVEGDNAYRTAIELGATEEEAQMRKFLVGTINASIEALQVSQVMKFAKVGRGSAKGILKTASDRAWKKALQKGGKLTYEAAKHSAAEALEEVLQETTQIASEAKYNPKVWDEATQRILMAGLGGGTVGLFLGGGGRVMTNLRSRAEAGQLTPQQLEVMNQTKTEYDAIVAEGGIGAKQKAEEVIRKGQGKLAALEGEEAAAAFEAEIAEMDREVREIQRPAAEVAKVTPEPPAVAIAPEIPAVAKPEAIEELAVQRGAFQKYQKSMPDATEPEIVRFMIEDGLRPPEAVLKRNAEMPEVQEIRAQDKTEEIAAASKMPPKPVRAKPEEAPQRPLVNPHATALQQDKQLIRQQAWDKKYGKPTPEIPPTVPAPVGKPLEHPLAQGKTHQEIANMPIKEYADTIHNPADNRLQEIERKLGELRAEGGDYAKTDEWKQLKKEQGQLIRLTGGHGLPQAGMTMHERVAEAEAKAKQAPTPAKPKVAYRAGDLEAKVSTPPDLEGIYFADHKEMAKAYTELEGATAKEVKQYKIELKNPATEEIENQVARELGVPSGAADVEGLITPYGLPLYDEQSAVKVAQELKKRGYDGVIRSNGEIVVFDKSSIAPTPAKPPTVPAEVVAEGKVEALKKQGYTTEQAELIIRNRAGMLDIKSPGVQKVLDNPQDYTPIEGSGNITVFRVSEKGGKLTAGQFVFTSKDDAIAFRDEFGFERGQPEIIEKVVDRADLRNTKENDPSELIFFPKSLAPTPAKPPTVPAEAVTEGKVVAFHGTRADIDTFRPLSHFGTQKAAERALESVKGEGKAKIISAELTLKNPLEVTDVLYGEEVVWWLSDALEKGVITEEESIKVEDIVTKRGETEEAETAFVKLLKSKGYDGLKYINKTEDKGSVSYVVFDPKQVKITAPTPAKPIPTEITEVAIGDTVKIATKPSTAHLTDAAGKTGKVVDIQIVRGKPLSWAVDIAGEEYIVDDLKDFEPTAKPVEKPEVTKEPGPAKTLETIREEGRKEADTTLVMPANLEDEVQFQKFVEQFPKIRGVDWPPVKAQKAIIKRFKRFAQGVPEFKLNPTFTFEKESGQLVFKDRYRFAFYPSHFGLDAEQLKDGQTIRFDLESFGIKKPTKAALRKAEPFLGEPKVLGRETKKPTPVKLYGESKAKPRKLTKAYEAYYNALVELETGKKTEVPGGITVSRVTEKDIERAARLGRKAGQEAWAVERSILYKAQQGIDKETVDIGKAIKIVRDVFAEKPAEVKAKVEPKRIISNEAYEKARKRLTDNTTFRTGLDPRGIADLITIGAYHFESGVRKFADWSKKMIEEFGEKAKPHLQGVWDKVSKKELLAEAAKFTEEAKLDEMMTKAEMGEVPIEGEFKSQSGAFNEHLDYFQNRQLPKKSKIPIIQAQMRTINGKRLAGTITAQKANKFIRQLRKELFETARKEGVALRMTKGGKLSLAVRKAGTYVPEEFAQYGKFKNIAPILGGGQDITRAVQQMDGALAVKEKVKTHGQAGPLERHVLWPTRDISMQKLNYIKEKTAELKSIFKAKRGSKEDKQVNLVLEQIAKGDRGAPIKDILNRKTLRAIASPKVIRQALGLRSFYDDLIEEQNLAREMRDQDPIPYRHNYSPHILRDTTIWERLMMRGQKAKDVFAKKADLPDYIKPNKPFNPRELAREAGIPYEERVLSATNLAESYLVTAAKDIFNTSIIQNNKAFIQQLEAMGHDKSANYLADWTAEGYAGIKPKLDRAISLPGKVEKGARYFNRLRNMAVFPLNMSWSMLTQTSSLALTVGRYGTTNTMRGFVQWLSPKIRKQAAENYYSYIVKSTKQGKLTRQDAQNLIGQKVELRRTRTELAQDISTLLLEQLEKLLTGVSIRAAHLHGKKRGLTGEALRQYASDGGAKTQSMYNDEDKPALLRSLIVKTAAPYQTFAYEVVNTMNEWAGRTGTPPDSKLYAVWTVTRFLAAATVFAALAKKFANKDVWSWKRPPIPFAEFWLNPIVKTFSNEWIGSASGLTSPIETATRVAKGIDDVLETGSWRKLRNELIKYGPGILGIPGGVQISRTVDAIIAYAQGGVRDRKGRLMFKMEDPQDLVQAIFSGVWSTEGGRGYLDPEYKWQHMTISELEGEIAGSTYKKRYKRDGKWYPKGDPHKGKEEKVARLREILKKKESKAKKKTNE